MKPENKHTPTPWRVGVKYVSRHKEYLPIGTDRNFFATVAVIYPIKDKILTEDEANAAHIVHCVNSHESLKAEIEQLKFRLERAFIVMKSAYPCIEVEREQDEVAEEMEQIQKILNLNQ